VAKPPREIGHRRPLRTAACLAALCVISLVSRLPQLFSRNLLVDGDEAVLGLMAKHVAQGREFPIFFYGQHYGLSAVEAGLGALSFRLFGTGDLSLKAAMLALWTAGVLFLFLALSARVGRRRAFWTMSIFILTPAWAVWSMKARGGYLTSFAATGALVWVLARTETHRSLARWIVAGVLTAAIALAQPLWLPSALPFVAAALVSSRRWSCAVAYICVTGAGVLLIKHVGSAAPETWAGPPIGNFALMASLPGLRHQIFANLTGSYYLRWDVAPGPVTTFVAYGWCLVLALTVPVQIYRLVARRHSLLSHLLFIAVWATVLACWALLFARDGRYLLPLSAPLVMLSCIDVIDLADARILPKGGLVALSLAALLSGILALREFAAFNFLWTNPPGALSEKARLTEVIGHLRARGATHVFTMNGLLNYQLMLYSDEQVVARWRDDGRYPAYGAEVDAALARGDRIAVVGYTAASGAPGCAGSDACTGGIEKLVPDPSSIITVDGKYFIYPNASHEILNALRF